MAKPRDSKSKKPVPVIRKTLAYNVEVLRDRVYRHLPNVTKRNAALAADIHSRLSQVQRICAGELGTSIDTIEWLATALGVRPQDLLTPYFATAKEAPPVEPISSAAEAQLQQSNPLSRSTLAQ